MPRLSVIDPQNASGRVKELFEGPLKGKEINILKGMANSPAALEAYAAMAGALANGQLSARERETIALALSQQNSCDYCLAAHTALGKQAGLTDDETLEIRRGQSSDSKLDALAKFTIALHEKRGWVSDEDFKAFKDAGYDDGAVAEVVANYVHTLYTNYFNHVNDTEVDFPAAQPI